MPHLEEMSAFFAARVDMYDEHMLSEVQGCREGYERMAGILPAHTQSLLDLGCGTGLELSAIFKRFPSVSVTGVDLTAEMLAVLRRKFPDRRLELIRGDYFQTDLGAERFDAAVSFQSLHHFEAEKKRGLFRQIARALKPGGAYVQCDYAADSDGQEAMYFAECERLRREQNLPESAFYHYDTPLTVEHEMRLLREAGFAQVELVWKMENTALLRALRS